MNLSNYLNWRNFIASATITSNLLIPYKLAQAQQQEGIVVSRNPEKIAEIVDTLKISGFANTEGFTVSAGDTAYTDFGDGIAPIPLLFFQDIGDSTGKFDRNDKLFVSKSNPPAGQGDIKEISDLTDQGIEFIEDEREYSQVAPKVTIPPERQSVIIPKVDPGAYYKVPEGATLSMIAKAWGISWESIRDDPINKKRYPNIGSGTTALIGKGWTIRNPPQEPESTAKESYTPFQWTGSGSEKLLPNLAPVFPDQVIRLKEGVEYLASFGLSDTLKTEWNFKPADLDTVVAGIKRMNPAVADTLDDILALNYAPLDTSKAKIFGAAIKDARLTKDEMISLRDGEKLPQRFSAMAYPSSKVDIKVPSIVIIDPLAMTTPDSTVKKIVRGNRRSISPVFNIGANRAGYGKLNLNGITLRIERGDWFVGAYGLFGGSSKTKTEPIISEPAPIGGLSARTEKTSGYDNSVTELGAIIGYHIHPRLGLELQVGIPRVRERNFSESTLRVLNAQGDVVKTKTTGSSDINKSYGIAFRPGLLISLTDYLDLSASLGAGYNNKWDAGYNAGLSVKLGSK